MTPKSWSDRSLHSVTLLFLTWRGIFSHFHPNVRTEQTIICPMITSKRFKKIFLCAMFCCHIAPRALDQQCMHPWWFSCCICTILGWVASNLLKMSRRERDKNMKSMTSCWDRVAWRMLTISVYSLTECFNPTSSSFWISMGDVTHLRVWLDHIDTLQHFILEYMHINSPFHWCRLFQGMWV